MNCQDVMTPAPVCCVPDDAVVDVARLMRAQDIGAIPVVADRDSQRLIGMVTDRDLAVRVVAEGRDARETVVRDVMSMQPVVCLVSDLYQQALQAMGEHQVRRIPVVDAAWPAGRHHRPGRRRDPAGPALHDRGGGRSHLRACRLAALSGAVRGRGPRTAEVRANSSENATRNLYAEPRRLTTS